MGQMRKEAPVFVAALTLGVLLPGLFALAAAPPSNFTHPSFDVLAWAGGIILLTVLVVVAMRLIQGRRHRERTPDNMVAYRVELDDTVMTIANRYGVVWQDLVKANRLKPPYDLKPGQRLLIPRHALVRPPETNKTI
jgi:hypothetical protein